MLLVIGLTANDNEFRMQSIIYKLLQEIFTLHKNS